MVKVIIKIVLSILLFFCLLDMPYGYYQAVRLISTIVFILLAHYAQNEKKTAEACVYIALAILFQPIFKIYLGRPIWNLVDIVVGTGLLFYVLWEWTAEPNKSEGTIQSTKNDLVIVHFDDHQLYRDGLRQAIEKERRNFKVYSINAYDSALSYISDCLDGKISIDVVITDFNHPGPNGYEFATEVKHIANLHGYKLPVLLLTMSTIENPRIVKGLEDGTFDYHLTKEANAKDIIETVESLCDVGEIISTHEQASSVKLKKINNNWIRWIGVLPAAVACYFIAYALIKLSDLISGRDEEGSYSLAHLFVPLIASGAAGFYFVFTGTSIAPYYKRIVGLILLILVVLLSGMGVFLLIINGFKWDLFLETTGQIVGAAIAFNQIKEQEVAVS